MKKLLIAILPALLIVGCGPKEEEGSTTPPPVQAKPGADAGLKGEAPPAGTNTLPPPPSN